MDASRASDPLSRTGDQLGPLQAITSALSRSLTPDEIGAVVIGHAYNALRASVASAFFCQPSGELRYAASRGIPPAVVEKWLVSGVAMPDLLLQTVRTGEPQWYETYAEFVAAVPAAARAVTPAERLQAVVVLPLRLGRRTLGVIGFSFSEPRHFGPEQRDFLLTVSEVCAQALDRAHLFEAERSARNEANEANRRLQMLSEATKAFAESNRDFSSALGVIAQSLTEMVGDSATIALISLIKGDGTVMENVAARAKDPEFAEELAAFAREHPQRLGQGLRGRVAATGEAVFIPVVDKEQLRDEIEPDYKPIFNRFKLSSIIVVPLRVSDRILGTISLSRADPRRPYTAADLAVVQELADRAALTIENARLYEAAQRAIRVRDHMLALAAHELATPLTVLRLQLSSLQRSELGAERSASKLEMATRCLERLDNVIDKFLDISCISAGQLSLTPEPVDLAALVRDVAGLFSERLARSECELDLHADQSIVGRWDKLRLEQVVTNLLSNACKYGRGKPIEVSVGSHGDMAFVQVRDNGIGIPPDKQARIFERLEHVVAQRDQSGLRLGLWICRELVDAQGGKISVESEPGVGSTFTVYLPWNGPRGAPA